MLSIHTMADLILLLFNIIIVYPFFWVLDRVSFHIVMLLFFNVCALLHERMTFWNNTFSEMSVMRTGQCDGCNSANLWHVSSRTCAVGSRSTEGHHPHWPCFAWSFLFLSTSPKTPLRGVSSYMRIDYPRTVSDTDKKAIASFVTKWLISFSDSFALATPLYVGCFG